MAWIEPPTGDLLALDKAIQELKAQDAYLTETIELRYITGRSVEEAASVLWVSAGTLKRDGRDVRAWRARRLAKGMA